VRRAAASTASHGGAFTESRIGSNHCKVVIMTNQSFIARNSFIRRWLAPCGCAALLSAAQIAWAYSATAPAPASAPKAPKTPAAAPAANDDKKTLYEMGVMLSRGLDTLNLSEAEFEAMKAGLSDGFHHRASSAEANTYTPKVQALQRARLAAVAEHEKETGRAYLDKAASQPGARRMPSGLLYVPLAQGTGATPANTDEVKVNYEGRLIDGTVFDASSQHGQAANLRVAGVIPCWSEALKAMKVGGKSRLVCPSDLAYGDRGALPNIKPGATLEFDVELLDVHAAASDGSQPAAPAASGGSTTK